MNHDPSSAWRALYERTQYRVRLARGGYAAIGIGRALPGQLRALLPRADAPWAFVTAWNPLSKACPRSINRAHQRQLLAALRRAPAPVVIHAGIGVGENASWREPSLFVAGIDEARLRALMRPFRQHAIVCGHGAGVARLLWLQ